MKTLTVVQFVPQRCCHCVAKMISIYVWISIVLWFMPVCDQQFYQLVKSWPPELYNKEVMVNSVVSRLDRDPDQELLIQSLGQLWVVDNNSPDYLAQLIISHQSCYTNSRNNLGVPRPRLHLFIISICFAGASLWNSLPQNIKSCNSLPCFTCNLHKYISENNFSFFW